MSAWLDALHFLRPQWLWALLALPLLAWLWHARRRQRSVWRGVVDAHLLPHLMVRGTGIASRTPLLIAAFAWILAVLALAGPSWRLGEQPLWQSKTPLVIVLDLSSRITATDLPPSRLLQVRAKLAQLLEAREGGQVALVVVADDAFTVAPLTEDAANVRLYLDDLSPEIMPVDGERIDRGITWATRLLAQAQFKQGDILLLADHADGMAREAAAAAHAKGYVVSALGVGTVTGAAYRRSDGALARAALDEGSLRSLASAGGGRYHALSTGQSDLTQLGVLLPEQATATEGGGAGKAWRDEGYWLVLPVLLLSLLAFRRGAVVVVIGALFLPMAMPAQAAGVDWWQRADQQQHAQLEQGAQAYRGGDFGAAEKAFTGIDTPEGWYNLGNALAKQGRYDDAIRAYDAALQRKPGMQDAVANRAAVDAARKRPPSSGEGQGKDSQDKGSQGNGEQGKGQQDSGPRNPASTPSPSQTPPSGDTKGAAPQRPPAKAPPAQSPPDAATQAAADAAQRERMRQAMAQQQAGQRSDKKPGQQAVAGETAEQRERRQAVDAWLRRVPDEPGALLKAKFRLEQERRQREGQ